MDDLTSMNLNVDKDIDLTENSLKRGFSTMSDLKNDAEFEEVIKIDNAYYDQLIGEHQIDPKHIQKEIELKYRNLI